jgi:hypothetical protein
VLVKDAIAGTPRFAAVHMAVDAYIVIVADSPRLAHI